MDKQKNDPNERGPCGERIVRCKPGEEPHELHLRWPPECDDAAELPEVYNLVPRSIVCQHRDAEMRRELETRPPPVKVVRMRFLKILTFFNL